MSEHAKGWLPDEPDDRDFTIEPIRGQLLKKAARVQGALAVPKVELFKIMSPVRDQTVIGSCTGQSGVALAESIGIEHLRDPFIPLSPLFLYYATRARARQTKVDAGATLRAMMKTLASVGVCPESLWPYEDVERRYAQRPSKAAYADTARFRVRNYYRVNGLDEIKIAIAAKNPVVGGFYLHTSFESDKVSKSGLVPMPGKRERVTGGHAMTIFGYDDNGGLDGRGCVIVKNSWGTAWGDHGLCYIPYDYFDPDLGLVCDTWTATV